MNKLQDNAVILDLTIRRPGVFRAERVRAETSANQRWLNHQKRLFDSDAYDAACRVQDEAKEWCRRRALPAGLSGYCVFPAAMVPEVYARLDRADEDLAEAADAFVAEYAALRERARAELKDLYREEQYPSPEAMRAKFRIERRLVELGTPGEDKIGKEFAEYERRKAKERWRAMEEDVAAGLREAFSELVGHLVERLAPAPNGGRKRLHETALEGLREFTDLFSKRNLLGDAELEQLVERARRLIAGKDVSVLRENDLWRQRLSQQMAEVKAGVDRLLTAAPRRDIKFEEE